MREILFRGKRVDNGEWAVSSDVFLGGKKKYIYIPNPDTDMSAKAYLCREIIPETVGQFTGLTDKNGKKIFEGDIVKFGKNIYQIIFDVGSFALYDEQGNMISKIGGHNDHCYSFMDLYIECCWEERNAYDIEVIGNIHDNPELLEG